MKKIILHLFLYFSFQPIVHSQLVAFPTEGLAIGSNYHVPWINSPDRNESIEYVWDTVLCNKLFHVFQEIAEPYGLLLMRYDSGKIYFNSFLNPCSNGTLQYDFSLEVGDTIDLTNWPDSKVVETGQISLLNGETRKYLKLEALPPNNWPSYEQFWIDGIGDIRYGFQRAKDIDGGWQEFVCARDKSGILYYNNDAGLDCDSLLCNPPKPSFTWYCENEFIHFQNQSKDADSYLWRFGDGTISTEENPMHAYANAGCYEVHLIAGTDCLPVVYEKIKTVPVSEPQYFHTIYEDSSDLFRYIFFSSAQVGWAATDKSLYKTVDGGQSWNLQIQFSGSPSMGEIDFLNDEIGVVRVFDYNEEIHVLKTNNGGDSWDFIKIESEPNLFRIDIVDSLTIFGSGKYDDLSKTTDGGLTWSIIDVPAITYATDVFALDSLTIFVSGYENENQPYFPAYLAKSLDGGHTWTVSTLPGEHGPFDICFINKNEGWIAGVNAILHTTDGGMTWEIQYESNEEERINEIQFVTPKIGWARGLFGKVLGTIDGGLTWNLQSCGLTDLTMFSLSMISADLGYLSYYIADSKTGVLAKYAPTTAENCGVSYTIEKSSQFLDFELFPNPSNGSVNIQLGEEWQKITSIDVCTPQGNLLRKVNRSNELKETIELSGIPPGVYFIIANDENGKSKVRKLIVFSF